MHLPIPDVHLCTLVQDLIDHTFTSGSGLYLRSCYMLIHLPRLLRVNQRQVKTLHSLYLAYVMARPPRRAAGMAILRVLIVFSSTPASI